ncbi:MAG: hypothetical protein ACJA0C_001576, partial [Candidatus Endobugula sp.]
MSYILESLKKSDQERHASQPSIDAAESGVALHESYLTAVNKKRSYLSKWSVVLSVVLCILGVFVAYAYWLPMDDASNRLQSLTDVGSPVLQSMEPPLDMVGDIQSLALNDEKEDTLQPIRKDVLVDLAINNEPLIKKEKVTHVSPAINALYQQTALEEKTSIDTLYESGNVLEEESSQNVIKNNSASLRQAAQSSKKESPAIPSVFSLDRQLQHSIPAINYGAHIYASDNKSGFVILDGVKRRAGEKMSNGVYIEKINEDLVVLSFRGVIF